MRKAVRLRLKGTIKSEFLEVYGNESPVYLPSANSIKCCSPPASLKANKMNFMEQANQKL